MITKFKASKKRNRITSGPIIWHKFFCTFLLKVFLISSPALAAQIVPGDLAPRGNTDGILNAADYLILQQIVLGQITPTPDELLAGDVAPLGASDGTLNAGDLVVLIRAINGQITLPNQAPAANAGGPYSATPGNPVSLDGSGSSDPENDALNYSWDFGDGSQGTGPNPGHVYTALGTYTITLTVSDGTSTDSATSPIIVTAFDSDNDGLPDSWEVSVGLNPTVNDASEDPDFDGFTNLEEFQNGTNPQFVDGSPDSNRLQYLGTQIDILSASQSGLIEDAKIDAQGNVYIAGYGVDDQLTLWHLMRLNADGTKAWAINLGADTYGLDLDGSGNIYVFGKNYGLLKVSASDGAITNSYPLPVGIRAVAVTNNAVYIAGNFAGTVNFNLSGLDEHSVNDTGSSGASAIDAFVTKLDTDFNYQWTRSFGSGSHDSASDLTVNASDDVFVSGGFWESVNFNRNISPVDPTATISTQITGENDLFTAKFNANGDFAWVVGQRQWSFTGITDVVSGIDADNNIHVVGPNQTVYKYSNSGVFNGSTSLKAVGSSSYKLSDISFSLLNGFAVQAGYFNGSLNFDEGGTDDTRTSEGGTDGFVRIADRDDYRAAFSIGGTGLDRVSAININDNGLLTIVGIFKDSVDFDYGPLTDTYTESSPNKLGKGIFVTRYKIYSLDTDQDGLPDIWETANGFNPNDSTDAALDSDGDGASNLIEYQNGSDPNNINGCLGKTCNISINPVPLVKAEPIPAENTASTIVGSTRGDFLVDESGSATYSIPIYNLPSPGGFAPSISLNYSSQGRNGLVGKGWSIGGLSSITRCRETLSQNGRTQPLNLISTNFCLDGQRLILTSGEYGKPGSTYKTETDSFAVITALGGNSSLTNPGKFKVERKDGTVSIYDWTVDAPGWLGQRTLTWMVTSISNSTGNSYSYYYDIPGQPDGPSINEIYYGNSNKIIFAYKDRQDVIRSYTAGIENVTDKRLASITVLNGGKEVRKYKLTYKTTNAMQPLSRLSSIQECASNNCLPATSFTWADASPGFGAKKIMAFTGDSEERFITKPADLNGDGKMDLLFTSTDYQNSGVQHKLFYAMSDGTQLQVAGQAGNYNLPDKSPFAFHVLDYNGDGNQDVMRSSGGNWVVHLSTGNQISTTAIDTQVPSNNLDRSIVVDFNSDGLADILYDKGNANYSVRYMEQIESPPGSGTLINQFKSQEDNYDFSSLLTQIPLQADEPGISWSQNGYVDWKLKFEGFATPRVGDFDGDGRVDVVAVVNSYYWLPTGFGDPETVDIYKTLVFIRIEQDGSFNISSQLQIPKYRWVQSKFSIPDDAFDFVPLDLNNDGLTDVITKVFSGAIDDGNYTTRVFLNTGTGDGKTRFSQVQDLGVIPNATFMYFTDYNHDGYLDMVNPPAWNANMDLRLWDSTNNKFSAPSATNLHFSGKAANIPRLRIADSYIFMDIDADGHDDAVHLEFSGATNTPEKAIYPSNSGQRAVNVITGIDNGFGNQTTIRYEPLTSDTVYSRETDALQAQWTLPGGSHSLGKMIPGGNEYLAVFDLKTPAYVVQSAESTAPAAAATPGQVDPGAVSRISYYYAGAKAQAGGRGLLGFHQIKSIDEQTGVETTTTYRQDYPFTGFPVETRVTTSPTDGSTLLNHSINVWQLQGWDGISTAPPPPYQPFLQQSTEKTYDLNGGELLSTVTTTNSYDDAGNVLDIILQTQDNIRNETYTQQTSSQYGSSAYDKRFGRLSRSQVTHSRTGKPSITRVSEFKYNTGGSLTGLLSQEIIEPGSPEKLVTTHEYDSRGNKSKITQVGAKGKNGSGGNQARYQRFEYDYNNLLARRYNSQEHLVENILSRNELGLSTQSQDINGVVTDTAYDAFGREYFTRDSTGAYLDTRYSRSNINCPGTTQYAKTTLAAGGAQTLTCFDALGREILTASPSFDGTWIAVNTEYDNLGRIKHKSNPHQLGTTPANWTTLTYDVLGRVIRIDHPQNPDYPTLSFSSNSYDGFTTTSINRKGQTKTETRNALDEIVTITDGLGGKIINDYDATGNLRVTTTSGPTQANGVPASITINMAYDNFGRKRSMNDPDQGNWSYDYNAFGELVEQRDNKGQSSLIVYDDLGRQAIRTDIKSGGSTEHQTIWTYVSNPNGNGLGQISRVTEAVSGFKKTFTYDSLGRLDETTTSIPGMSKRTEKVTYDEFGRIFQSFDAAGDYARGNYTGIENEYNGFGYLARVLDADVQGGTQRELYAVGAMDKWGNITQEWLGDGSYVTNRNYHPVTGYLQAIYTDNSLFTEVQQNLVMEFDVLGNLTRRTDVLRNRVEAFGYDGLNRLISTKITEQLQKNVTYDSYGNIRSKDGVGTYTYSQGNAGPHAVSRTSDGSNTTDYSYDANGNLTSDSNGRSVGYSTYNKPLVISKGSNFTTFSYDPDRARYQRTDTDPTGTTTTYYIGSVEIITYPDGSSEVKRYINGKTLISAIYDNAGNFQSNKTDLLLKDHLGSVNVIVKSDTTQIPLSFDAWGQRRNALTWEEMLEQARLDFDTSITRHGYTSHEMIDKTGFIHMNGRVYDPRLGRFASADFLIQDPGLSQSYNRYSYVINNPLTLNDPTGQIFQFLLPALAAYTTTTIAQGIFGDFVTPISGIIGCATGNIATCAGATAGTNYAATGDFKASLKAGAFSWASATAFNAIGNQFENIAVNQGKPLSSIQTAQKIAEHAAVGGVMSVLQGGKFGHGFVSTGIVQSFAAPISNLRGEGLRGARVVAAAIVGGTASELTGGEFANGATTGAFSYLFNDAAHELTKRQAILLSRAAQGQARMIDSLSLQQMRGTFPDLANEPNNFSGDLVIELARDNMLRSLSVMRINSLSVVISEGFATVIDATVGSVVLAPFKRISDLSTAITIGNESMTLLPINDPSVRIGCNRNGCISAIDIAP